MKFKAVRFLRDVVGDSDKADEFDSISPEEYALHKGITILENMPATASPAKAELEQALDDIEAILDDALDPELSREEVVSKVKEAYDIACGDEDEDESDETEETDETGEGEV
jgi:hypothetical protein